MTNTTSTTKPMNKYRIRNILQDEMKKLTAGVKAMGLEHPFHFKYTQHFIDDLIKRNIDVYHVLELLEKSLTKVDIYQQHLSLPVRPSIDDEMVDGVQYRPVRIEVTDGVLWIGITADKPFGDFEEVNTGMQCRMAIVNKNRLPSRISCDVINLKEGK